MSRDPKGERGELGRLWEGCAGWGGSSKSERQGEPPPVHLPVQTGYKGASEGPQETPTLLHAP